MTSVIRPPYRIPAETHRLETVVSNSRFITTVVRSDTVEQAKQQLAQIRAEMPNASHHVYAFRIGYGNSVIEGMSDDGEPSGTAGPPTLAVLRGTDIGDILLVTTRYFGGTKLGTGGLVRTYGDAAKTALSSLKTEAKIRKCVLGIEILYTYYEQVKRLILQHDGVIQDETFGGDITVIAVFPITSVPEFRNAVIELTTGRTEPIILGES